MPTSATKESLAHWQAFFEMIHAEADKLRARDAKH